MNKKYLLLYGLLTVGIAVALWGLNLWAAENIMYGLLIVPIQLGLMQLVFKHRESADSYVNHLVIVSSTLFIFLFIYTIFDSLFIYFLIALIMLIIIILFELYNLFCVSCREKKSCKILYLIINYIVFFICSYSLQRFNINILFDLRMCHVSLPRCFQSSR